MIRKFKVIATRTDEYVIELEEERFNDEWKEEFGKFFHKIEKLEDVVRDLAFSQLRFGDGFFEGYGDVLRNGKLPFSSSDFDSKGNWLPENERRQPADGINIIIESEDDDYDFEIEEVTNA